MNAGALPDQLIEAELFGTEAGAFTGAKARAGRFEAADGGTLFLDEIGNLPLAGQAKLLRVLQTGEYERLGSNTTRRANVRIVAATNMPLRDAMREGRFREDLYYRLSVIELALPPLAERRDDVLPLTRAFLPIGARLTSDAERALLNYSWPGNVRELRNVLQRAALLAGDAPINCRHAQSPGRFTRALRRARARPGHHRARARRERPHRGPGGAPARHEPAGPLSPHGKTRYQGIPGPSGLSRSGFVDGCAGALFHGRLGHAVARRHRAARRVVAHLVATHYIDLALDGAPSPRARGHAAGRLGRHHDHDALEPHGARARPTASLSLKDRDFSVSVTRATRDEMGELVDVYNGLGDKLRVERQSLYQRELMLDTVIQTTPLALVLTNDADAVLYSNTTARQLFGEGRKLEGETLLALPRRGARAAARGHRARRRHAVHARARRRAAGVSRVAAALPAERPAAPAAAAQAAHARDQFAGGGHLEEGDPRDRARAEQFPGADLLAGAFRPDPRACAARPRAAAAACSPPSKIARGISPASSRVMRSSRSCRSHGSRRCPGTCCSNGCAPWSAFTLAGPLPQRAASFDTAQIEQALINLLKNARESGSERRRTSSWRCHSPRRGSPSKCATAARGSRGAALENALVPFYSTKETGTGLGLTLCREIVEAHGGRLRIANREGGGAVVAWLPMWLPDG